MVVPVELADGSTVYVHSTPIGREVFETYFENFSRTFTQIYAGGHGITSAPRIAYLLLKKDAQEHGNWEGERGVRRGLFEEIARLTSVVAPGAGGWTTMPWDEAVKAGVLDEDDVSEVWNALAYFTLASAMHKKAELRPMLEAALSLWGARPESLNCTEFIASLPTSTPTDNSGEKATLSSIPQ
jgi:hypothetical protein